MMAFIRLLAICCSLQNKGGGALSESARGREGTILPRILFLAIVPKTKQQKKNEKQKFNTLRSSSDTVDSNNNEKKTKKDVLVAIVYLRGYVKMENPFLKRERGRTINNREKGAEKETRNHNLNFSFGRSIFLCFIFFYLLLVNLKSFLLYSCVCLWWN